MDKLSQIEMEELVAYNKKTNISKCLVCKKELKGYLVANIRRHYKLVHTKEKIDKTKLVAYDKKTNISKCRLCQRELVGYSMGHIKEHYEAIHKQKLATIRKSKGFHPDPKSRISKCLLCHKELKGYSMGDIKADDDSKCNCAPKIRPKIDKTKLVSYNKKKNISKCLLCGKELKGYLLGNIRRHYETIHKQDIFDVVQQSRSSNVDSSEDEDNDSNQDDTDEGDQPMKGSNASIKYGTIHSSDGDDQLMSSSNASIKDGTTHSSDEDDPLMISSNASIKDGTIQSSAEVDQCMSSNNDSNQDDTDEGDQPMKECNASIKYGTIHSSDGDDQLMSSNNASIKDGTIHNTDEVHQPVSSNNASIKYGTIHSSDEVDQLMNASIKEETIHSCDEVDQPTNGNNTSKHRNSNQSVPILTKNDLLKRCIGLVTTTNIPLRIFDDDINFRSFIEPFQSQFELNLSAAKIAEYTNCFANNIKDMLKQSLANKMFCLKLDLATRLGILVINIQHIKDYKIVVNTIGIIQINKRHTPNILKGEILNCLSEFDIELNQIYATILDNGANITSSQLLQQDSTDFKNAGIEIFSEYEDDDYEEVHHCLSSLLEVARCAAHTFQLAAHDFLKEIKSKLEECSKFSMAIIRSGLNSTSLPLPPIDKITEWNSTLEMMESLLNLRQHIDGNEMALSPNCEIDWNFVENFVNVFTPLAEFTKQFKAEQYFIGDFYRDWLICEVKLKKMVDNALAIKLLVCMMKRRDILLDNVAFLSGIYFDPRFNFLDSPYINGDQKHRAVEHILKTNGVLTTLTEEENTANESHEEMHTVPSNPYTILEEELNNMISSRPSTQTSANIRQKLQNLANGQRICFSTNVLEYWKSMSNKERELSTLAEVILAVPSSQVSIERVFSALDTIKTQGSKLHSDTINNMLIVKLNNNLVDDVNF